MLAWVGQHEDSPLIANVVVSQMMRLQQFACAYAEFRDGELFLAEPSSKLDAVMDILSRSDKPIVIFTQFKKLIYLLEKRLQKAGIEYVRYTGDDRKTREDDKERFIRGEARVFMGTITAGGVGLDGLQQAADTMIFTDRLWNPALNQQAEDRLWRDGQKNAVQIIDIMAYNTVDLGRKQRIDQVWGWIRRLLGDTRALQSQEVTDV
jgi:SNF2 family DNA or RNA helicase